MSAEWIKIILQLFGGLCLFIYGMNFMSDGLQKAAGEKMKGILAMLTRNVFIGVLAGAAATAVLQSSGAVTVMVIGFVSAKLMTLRQAISIIMGANIGTCVTAQLVAFKIGDYAWIFVIIGFIMYFFLSKKEKVMEFGQAIFAFGILFTGLNLMADAMQPLAQSPVFSELLLKVADVPILGVIVGAVMTTIVQSSSASIAVLQNLAATAGPDGVSSLIGLVGAIPILFGTNIGSTTTALLASIGGTTNAKRTAISHTIFNLVGTLIFIWFTALIADFVTMISPSGDELDVISRQIANAHLSFNVATTLIFLPFIGVLEKVVTKLIPEKAVEGDPMGTVFLDYNVLEQPFAAIHLATKELSRMAEITGEMLVESKKAFLGDDMEAYKAVKEKEEHVNHLRDLIIKYLSSMFSAETVTERQALAISGMMHVVQDVEHIGDNCENIADFAKEKAEFGYTFSDTAYAEIYQCFEHIGKMLNNSVAALSESDADLAKLVKQQEEEMDTLEGELRIRHMKRLDSGECSPENTVLYMDVIHNLERMGDNCENIAHAVLDGHRLKTLIEEQ